MRFIKQFIIRLLYYNSKNVKFGSRVVLNRYNFFEGGNYIYDGCQIQNSYLGYGTYIAPISRIAYTKIGRFCSIGRNVQTHFGVHPTKDFVSTHPAFFSMQKQAGFTFVNKQLIEEHIFVGGGNYVVEIGNDVWIGNNVQILDGITIGDGAIIAAGSIVSKDVKPYTIVGGIPARIIRNRFNNEEIEFLIKFKWWEKDISFLKKNIKYFSNINKFIYFLKPSMNNTIS